MASLPGGEMTSYLLIASMKLSVDCSLCGDLSVKGLRMLVKCFESW